MSISEKVSIYDCTVNLAKDLKEWATLKKFGFAFAKDLMRNFELLSAAPTGGTLILSLTSRSPSGDSIRRPLSEMNYTATLIVNDPLDISPEKDYQRGPDQNASLLETVAELEKRIMSFTPPSLKPTRDSDMDRVMDKGTTPATLQDGQPLTGYTVSFSFKVQTPQIQLR